MRGRCSTSADVIAGVLFLGEARAATCPETLHLPLAAMFPVASAASVSGWVASIEVALRFAMFAALIYATLGFMPRADVSPVMLSGHSLGVNVAHTVAGR
ncbi:unnamed protein product [Symbiodinium natans]|uniref:Uncharacterized protein n=1 Tax=Symbiodinium natans TaxID=878477 RepID=A0A812LIP3_9DINO|nr:unnamed protein product [Symbiodinium natans]